ncbi:hypothetical protein X946_4787 [Burkholderia sp. ABCPW 111]|nr:hypothetical protein X946_4787 [Burkholderia sp. ABCPW 111]
MWLTAFASAPAKLSSAPLLIDASAEPSAPAWIAPCCASPASANVAPPEPALPRSPVDAETGRVFSPPATAGVAAATPNATAADSAMLVNLKFCFICDLVWIGTAVITARRSSHGACQHVRRVDRPLFSSKMQIVGEFNCSICRTGSIVNVSPYSRYERRNVTMHCIPLHSISRNVIIQCIHKFLKNPMKIQ